MKKITGLFTVLLLLTCTTFAQSPLTNGEVYDFDIGDVFEREHGGVSGPPSWLKKIITSKTYSANMDTVFYGVDFSWIVYDGGMAYIAGQSGSVIESYTNLNSPCLYAYSSIGGDSIVTGMALFHGRDVNVFEEYATPILSAGFGKTRWGNGLGLVYYRAVMPGNGIDELISLKYYKKGTEIVGGLMTDLDESILQEGQGTVLYPNPTHRELRVELVPGIHPEAITYEVLDLQGKRLMEGVLPENKTLIVELLPEGSYFLRLKTGDSQTGYQFSKMAH